MKILYLIDTDLDQTSGVASKILMQANMWQKEGHEVDILSWDSLSWFSLNGRRKNSKNSYFERKGVKVIAHLMETTLKLLNLLQNHTYDIIYMRYRLYAPLFSKIKKNAKLIVEINSNDIYEFRRSQALYVYNRLFREFFLRNVDGFVCVSEELATLFCQYKVPTTVIANGINVRDYSFIEYTNTKRPQLVFIGSPNQQWHGVEKIFYMAKYFPQFDFHIIGQKGKGSENLTFHGYLDNKKAKEIVGKMDIGISSLALYKKNMNEASPLKSRQYLAQGLPMIYAYEDTDIKQEYTFCCKLPNTPRNVENSLKKIEKFVNNVYHDSKTRMKARKFAESKLDINIKEKKRIEFFQKVINEES